MNETTEIKKADVMNQSIKSLRTDIALVKYLHSQRSPTRMKTIMDRPEFHLLSETSIRRHLKSLVSKGALEESKEFRGQYCVSSGGYYPWVQDCKRYVSDIIGSELFDLLKETDRR